MSDVAPQAGTLKPIMSDRRAQIDRWIEQGAIGEARSGLNELLSAEGLRTPPPHSA
jgi:hypothetical protein